MFHNTNPVNNIRVIIDMGVTIKLIREKASKNKFPRLKPYQTGVAFILLE